MGTDISLNRPGCFQIRIHDDRRVTFFREEKFDCQMSAATISTAASPNLGFPQNSVEEVEPFAVKQDDHPLNRSSSPFARLL